MTTRRIARLFLHATLVAIRDSINDFHAALVPALELVIDEIMERASEEAEREHRETVERIRQDAVGAGGKHLWN